MIDMKVLLFNILKKKVKLNYKKFRLRLEKKWGEWDVWSGGKYGINLIVF